MNALAASAAAPSRFAVWRSLETDMDRWASYGALALATGASLAVLVVLF